MSEETAKLERDNTMVATAKEGEAFLEAQGKVDKDAKTRAQQKEIEEITATDEDDPELRRTRTMAETAKEGQDLLDGEDLGKTRSQTKNEKNGTPEENGDKDDDKEPEKEAEGETNGTPAEEEDEKSPVKRTRTIEDTVKEGEEFLKKQKIDTEDAEGKQEVKS